MRKIVYGLLIIALLFGWSGVKPVSAATTTFVVSSSSDDVNEDGSTLTLNSTTLWLGNGASKTSSFAAVRFTNVSIPKGASITSAKLNIYSTQNQWLRIRMSMAGELSPNSATFSSTSKPSQRTLTSQKINYNSNDSWSANSWYLLDEMAPVVQEIVNQSGWQTGNSLSIILKGSGNAWGRKFIASVDGSSTNAPTLVITYSAGTIATTTPTPLPPTATRTPLAATSTAILSTPTRTATPLPPTLTFTPTSTIVPPTRTSTPTSQAPSPTATSTQPPPTPTNTPVVFTPTPGMTNTASFPIGPGWADVTTHQIVRTLDDRLYFFGSQGEDSPILYAYWTTSAGMPGIGSDFSGSVQVNNGSNILSTDIVYDGSHTIHVITNGIDGKITDRPFDTLTNQFRTNIVLATNGATLSGYYLGTSGISGAMDTNQVLHVAYWSTGSHITYRSYTYNSSTDALTPVDGPTQLDANAGANHPVLAVSPLDGSLTAGWVSQASNPAQILTRTKRSGTWGSPETASSASVWTSTSAGINVDQGPSLIIGPDGTKYLVYMENWRVSSPYDYGRIHFVTNNGAGWIDQYIGSYTHDPSIAMNSAGQIFILGHGYPLNSACTNIDDLCLYQRNGDGTWATPKLFLAHQGTQSFDDSVSVKWSVVGYNRPETIEFVFSDVGAGYNNAVIYYGRIGSN